MDNTKGSKMTRRVRIPFKGKTLRSLPFESHHLVALTMAQQLAEGRRKLDVLLRMLLRLLGEADYAVVMDAFMDGEADMGDLTTLLNNIVEATKALNEDQPAAPAAERDFEMEAAETRAAADVQA